MLTPDLHIASVGVHLPAGRASLKSAIDAGLCDEDEFFESDLVEVPVADGVAAADMAVEAGRQALQRAGLDPSNLDLLVHAPMSREAPEGWASPGYLLRELKCGRAASFAINQGCNGTLAGIELAAAWLSAARDRSSALVTSSLRAIAPYLQRWTSAGFGMALGDGASAVLLSRSPGVARVEAVNSRTLPELEGLHRGALDLADQESIAMLTVDVPARAREFAVRSEFDSLDMHRIFSTMYAEIARETLAEAGIGTTDLTKVVFTNAGAALIEADVMGPLGLSMNLSTWDFGRTIGHVGASDHVFSLDHLLNSGEVEPGDRVLMLGGTQGYNVAAVALTVT
ncbi:ketoacyl-ACP synthase III family protein [Micromonospora endolithica]|uniref:3-oxoacyl-ACP synthase n=1 Tax=Micromonospora endolithica TaxID=230091 RepID=A0A3A9ZPZ2_9ACTN|nr:ketoacyl-ACP synthase III family protein [Micromonospora endolithica]RKN50259.1 3-oxoacyl-ACP synthase [Micromonospora endolithica]TWJ21099.1 3-oxoacyl-[acyl-carrier-protein] synthase-3 [Micromonospora endolithica]